MFTIISINEQLITERNRRFICMVGHPPTVKFCSVSTGSENGIQNVKEQSFMKCTTNTKHNKHIWNACLLFCFMTIEADYLTENALHFLKIESYLALSTQNYVFQRHLTGLKQMHMDHTRILLFWWIGVLASIFFSSAGTMQLHHFPSTQIVGSLPPPRRKQSCHLPQPT